MKLYLWVAGAVSGEYVDCRSRNRSSNGGGAVVVVVVARYRGEEIADIDDDSYRDRKELQEIPWLLCTFVEVKQISIELESTK